MVTVNRLPAIADASSAHALDTGVARVAVVIPAYKPLDTVEAFVLRHNMSVLSARPAFLLCPASLDISGHTAIAPSLGVLRVENKAMDGWLSYSALMTSLDLYQTLARADYVLLLQLDAIVLADEIDKWTGRALDYVGPPWFTRGPDILKRLPNPAVPGIGGVSLRRTQSFIHVLEQGGERWCGFTFPRTRLHPSPKWKMADVLRSNRSWAATRTRALSGALTEDEFWAMEVPRWFAWSMPSARESLNFAFDFYPRRSLALTRRAPFAVHGRRNVEGLFAVFTEGATHVEVDEFGRGDIEVLEALL